jgi:hypothetical protein
MNDDMHTIRGALLQSILAAARADERIAGVVDYGSSSEGRGDAWSDLDLALFIRDADLAAFEREWKPWAAQFGPLLLAYVGGIGHPWTVYDTRPLPLRVDFAFHPASAVDIMLGWPNSPISPQAMVLYDGAGGAITSRAAQLVGRSLGPADPRQSFEQVGGDIWYFLLRTWSKLQRGQEWAAYFDYNHILLGNLMALLRLESGATERWRSSSSAVQIEQAIAPERLDALNGCRVERHGGSVGPALLAAARLAYQACAATAARHGWPWPQPLADRVLALLGAEAPF